MQRKLKQAVTRFEESPFNSYEGPEDARGDHRDQQRLQPLFQGGHPACSVRQTRGPAQAGHDLAAAAAVHGNPAFQGRGDFHGGGGAAVSGGQRQNPGRRSGRAIGIKKFHGRSDGTLPTINELNPDLVAAGLAKILGIEYQAMEPAYAETGRRGHRRRRSSAGPGLLRGMPPPGQFLVDSQRA